MVKPVILNPSNTRKRRQPAFGQPPKSTRFKPGQSGNPKGRPKGVRNFETELHEALQATVEVRRAGGVRRITTQKALLQSLVEQALHGDPRHLISLILRYRESTGGAPRTAMDSDDRAILDEYYKDRKALEAEQCISATPNTATRGAP